MKVFAWLSLVASSGLFAACGGYTSFGDEPTPEAGSGGQDEGSGGTMSGGSSGKGSAGSTMGKGGTSMGTGGSSAGTAGRMGSGGSQAGMGGSAGGDPMSPCTGLPCGSACPFSGSGMGEAPADGGGNGSGDALVALGYCSENGTCGLAFPVCSGTMCMTDMDCPSLPPVCTTCSDGGYSCPSSVCVNGACVVSEPGCNNECETSMDCAVAVAPCQVCPNGDSSCTTVECVMGRCVGSVPGCGDYKPCDGLACGDQCSVCAPDDMNCAAPAVLSFCNDAGLCQTGVPTCGGTQCMSAGDCPLTDVCRMCEDGSCGGVGCVNGRCVQGCPNDPVECKETIDCGARIAVCQPCADSSCAQVSCVGGKCELVCPSMQTCTDDDECPSCGACGDLTVCVPYTCKDSVCVLECAE